MPDDSRMGSGRRGALPHGGRRSQPGAAPGATLGPGVQIGTRPNGERRANRARGWHRATAHASAPDWRGSAPDPGPGFAPAPGWAAGSFTASSKILHLGFGLGKTQARVLLAMQLDGGNPLGRVLGQTLNFGRQTRRRWDAVMLKQRVQLALQPAHIQSLPRRERSASRKGCHDDCDNRVISKLKDCKQGCHRCDVIALRPPGSPAAGGSSNPTQAFLASSGAWPGGASLTRIFTGRTVFTGQINRRNTKSSFICNRP